MHVLSVQVIQILGTQWIPHRMVFLLLILVQRSMNESLTKISN
jgi:hypothetical protein